MFSLLFWLVIYCYTHAHISCISIYKYTITIQVNFGTQKPSSPSARSFFYPPPSATLSLAPYTIFFGRINWRNRAFIGLVTSSILFACDNKTTDANGFCVKLEQEIRGITYRSGKVIEWNHLVSMEMGGILELDRQRSTRAHSIVREHKFNMANYAHS